MDIQNIINSFVNMIKSQNITDWLIAIGTCGAVIVSVLGKTIRYWWNKPKINITCFKKEPCLVEIIDGSSSNEEDKK